MKLIDIDAVLAKIEKLKGKISDSSSYCNGWQHALRMLELYLDTLEVKEVNEVPATVMVNKYGNRFISSWPGLKEYDGLKEGEEIKVVIPKK